MSVSETAKRPGTRGRSLRIWIAILALDSGCDRPRLGRYRTRCVARPRDSGLRIRTVQEGSGPFVQSVDGVLVEYEGRLADGTVFDASERHGGPQPMIAGQVIPGFAEALTKMQKGGKYTIHIPSAARLWRRTRRPGSPIRPNADLDFDVHVVQIVPNAALMSGGGEAPGGAQPQQAPQPEQAPNP